MLSEVSGSTNGLAFAKNKCGKSISGAKKLTRKTYLLKKNITPYLTDIANL